jgi:hypothetical protein
VCVSRREREGRGSGEGADEREGQKETKRKRAFEAALGNSDFAPRLFSNNPSLSFDHFPSFKAPLHFFLFLFSPTCASLLPHFY